MKNNGTMIANAMEEKKTAERPACPPLRIFVFHPSDLLTDHRAHGDGLIADAFLRRLAAKGHEIHIAINRCDLRDPYPSNVTLHEIDTGGKKSGIISRLKYCVGIRRLRKELAAKGKIDLMHQLNPVVTGLCFALLGSKEAMVLGPYVPDWPLYVYDGKLQEPRLPDRIKLRLKQEFCQLQHRMSSAIILCTPAALDKVRNKKAYGSRVHIIPYGIDVEEFTASPLPSSPTILFVGSLMFHKGVFVLLDAFKRVAEKMPSCRLIYAGGGSEEEELKRQAALMSDPAKVEFLGRVVHSQLPDLFRNCTVCCVPSFGEAFGLVALEAMACGRPVVGTNANGLAYLIPEEGGRKVPVGDPTALANALLEILSNPELAASMSTFNRRLAVEKFSWERVIADVESAYCSAIDQVKGSRP